jgi:UDP-3-O-[3-hydroxymyristoyl] glucosamine N-acyltransferase
VDVPEIQRVSSAFTQVREAIEQRRGPPERRLQREQQRWRDEQQRLANDRANLSPEQLRNRERDLQDRITDSQRVLRDRARDIEQLAQGALREIEQALGIVIRQVASTRGVNLVLPRPLVIFNEPPFDLTEEVAAQLNRMIPNVTLPAEAGETPAPAQQRPANPPRQGAAGAGPGPAAELTGWARIRASSPLRGRSPCRPSRWPPACRWTTVSACSPMSHRLPKRGRPRSPSWKVAGCWPALRETRAGAVFVSAAAAKDVPAGCLALVTETPQLAYARVAALFHPSPAPVPGIHPTAVVAPDARIGEGTEIGPHAVIGAGAEIGAGCIIGRRRSSVPAACSGLARCCARRPRWNTASPVRALCSRRALGSATRVFGFITTSTGEHVTVPQVGRVILGDGVEIGANSCVDRGAGGDTVLGPGTRLDNLVQIGHNVKTGRGCVIVAQAGIAGSAELGDFVVIAAQAGLVGHITIGDKARVGAQAGVMNDVPAATDVVGSPAWPARETLRAFAKLRQLAATKRDGTSGGTP